MVTIYVAGFQTVAIFMQTGNLDKSEPVVDTLSDVVKDTPNKVLTWIVLYIVLPFLEPCFSSFFYLLRFS